ncbi:MAG: hypothetical protein FJ224_11560 [Lentisphaerae bacterium]|nr:hypothetical protein [Lentisphaerota bacterium]
MPIVAVVLYIVGFITMAVGGIMLIVAAFKKSVGWGLAVLFLSPLAAFVFVAMNWQEARKAFMIQTAGFLAALIPFFLLIFSLRNAVPSETADGEETPPESLMSMFQKQFQPLRDASDAILAVPEDDGTPNALLGRDLDYVRNKRGRPKGEMSSAGRIVWMYEGYMVMSEDGKKVSSVIHEKDYEAAPVAVAPQPSETTNAPVQP